MYKISFHFVYLSSENFMLKICFSWIYVGNMVLLGKSFSVSCNIALTFKI